MPAFNQSWVFSMLHASGVHFIDDVNSAEVPGLNNDDDV